MKIIFICPTREWLRIKSPTDKPKGTPFLRLPSLAAAVIAALTPRDCEFKLIDEQIDFLDFDESVDLVAVTCNTATSTRAYEIATEYKKRKIPVILGGIHPTLNSEEASRYGTVVIGPAEPVWESILNDFGHKKLKKIYKSSSRYNLVRPDRSVFNAKKFITTNLVETSRGCIYRCNFCSTASAFKGNYITKEINSVVDEIKSLNGKTIIIVDDNLIGNISHSKELFKALIPLKIKWVSQVTYLFGLDEELLDLASKSGCIGVFIGFDSISNQTLKDYNKTFGKVELYKKSINNIHKKGIMIQGSFIFGSDLDNQETFDSTLKFIYKNKIEGVFFGISTPLPNTPLYAKLKSEKRITTEDYNNYDYRHCVFKPASLTQEELEDGVKKIVSNYFRKDRISKRFLRSTPNLISQGSFLLFIGYYLAFLSRINMLKTLKNN